MPDRNFGRGGLNERTRRGMYRSEPVEPVEVVITKPPMTAGQIAWGIFGIVVGVGVLFHSLKDDHSAAVPASPAAIVARASPTKCGATLAEYQTLQIGINLDGAVRIIGCRGTEDSRVAYGGQETVRVSWPGEGFLSSMSVTFSNDRLIAKSQFGLE